MRSVWARWAQSAALRAAACVVFSSLALAQHYQQTNLVSDVPGLAAHTDSDLVNCWGMVRSGGSPWWVSDNGTGKSTLYNATGTKIILGGGTVPAVVIPPPVGSSDPATPTGIVANGGSGFVVAGPLGSGPARFIFATEDGTISGWSPSADLSHAILKVPNEGAAIYKGLAINTFNGATLLYAANFLSGQVEVFNDTWGATLVPGGFADASLPQGYAPFNVQSVGSNIFVTFAKQGTPPDEVDGRGLGFVDEFDSGGTLLMRLQHGPWFDAPWGVAVAPGNFGEFSNDILVGNFGSGRIAAFSATGEFEGFLHGAGGPLVIDGLWALAFGGGNASSGMPNELFFTAGIDGENHGLFGKLTAVADDDAEDQNDDAATSDAPISRPLDSTRNQSVDG